MFAIIEVALLLESIREMSLRFDHSGALSPGSAFSAVSASKKRAGLTVRAAVASGVPRVRSQVARAESVTLARRRLHQVFAGNSLKDTFALKKAESREARAELCARTDSCADW